MRRYNHITYGGEKMNLTKEELHNLLVFLERVQMTGKEAAAYISLVQKITQYAAEKQKEE